MRRTNSKEVKKLVRDYILECEEVENLTEVKERFISEYGWYIRRVGEVNACIEWLRGLAISCDYYFCDIAVRLAGWLDDSVESQKNWIDKKGDGLYWLLMAREIVNAK